jgi:hypothetical protein
MKEELIVTKLICILLHQSHPYVTIYRHVLGKQNKYPLFCQIRDWHNIDWIHYWKIGRLAILTIEFNKTKRCHEIFSCTVSEMKTYI